MPAIWQLRRCDWMSTCHEARPAAQQKTQNQCLPVRAPSSYPSSSAKHAFVATRALVCPRALVACFCGGDVRTILTGLSRPTSQGVSQRPRGMHVNAYRRTMFASRFVFAALPSVAAAPPSSFKLIGHPKECSCLDATDVVRQAELETFLAQTPGAPLLPANHDKGERCQRLGHRIVDRSVQQRLRSRQ